MAAQVAARPCIAPQLIAALGATVLSHTCTNAACPLTTEENQ